MTPAEMDIEIFTGTDFDLTLTITDDTGSLMDFTGCTAAAMLREFSEDDDYIEFTVSHNGAGGQVLMEMSHELTAKIGYAKGVYDLIKIDGNGKREPVLKGNVKVNLTVTR